MDTLSHQGVALWRRLAALVYDLLLLTAVLFLMTALLLPFSGGDAILPDRFGAWAYAYRAALLAATWAYFFIPWTRRGQTLGMASWKIRLQRRTGGLPGWRECTLRVGLGLMMGLSLLVALCWQQGPTWLRTLAAAPAVLNYAWSWRDQARRTLQDRMSGCVVERVRPSTPAPGPAR